MALVAAIAVGVLAAVPDFAESAVPTSQWYWALTVASSNSNVLLLGTGQGLYRSNDGGRYWKVTGPAGLDATSIVQSGSKIFAAGVLQKAHALPTVSTHGEYLVGKGKPVFVESTDDGTSWSRLVPKGLPAIAVQALAVDPGHDQTVYAVLRNGAVYRSTDSAASFQLWAGKIGGTPWALAITVGGHFVAGNMTTGAYQSANGASWLHTAFTDPRGSHMVMEYAVQPTDTNHVLMTSYGVLSSTDGGTTWQPSLKSKVMFGPVAFSPGTPTLAYAVGWDHSLWRTDDAGGTWTQVG
ncbi:MAG TPA: YCF48-related protein [Gaiellaceae bacterium]